MLVQRGANGRFRSTVGFRKVRLPTPDSRYELLVCDKDWQLLHPHLIRHASVTERFSLIDELFPDDTHKRRTLQDLVESDIGRKSPETKQRYIHTLSAAEALELVNGRWVRRLMERAYTLDTALASEGTSSALRAHTVGGVCVPEVADTLDWLLTTLNKPS